MGTVSHLRRPVRRVSYMGDDIAIHRVLVTGSRTWIDRAAIRDALAWVWDPRAVLVTGRARGADAMAEDCWRTWGGEVDPRFAARWDLHGKRAGYVRNHLMIRAGADICLAFIRGGSRGASHCAAWADVAGIPTLVIARDVPPMRPGGQRRGDAA